MSEKSSAEQIKPQPGLVLVRANTRDKIRLESWASIPGQHSLSHPALHCAVRKKQQI